MGLRSLDQGSLRWGELNSCSAKFKNSRPRANYFLTALSNGNNII